MLYYKLKRHELRILVEKGLLTQEQADTIIATSERREPGTHADTVEKIGLNPSGSVQVRSIAFYGGEHFKQPYCFIAEVVNLTTNSAFSRFLNRHGLQWLRQRLPFTY